MLRVSVGLESRTLQKLYGSSAGADMDVRPYHWFSLHTASRSYDFGANRECGDENETLMLWVLTLEQLVAPNLPPASVSAACCALSHAQTQWQRFASATKEWPCFACTMVNAPENATQCGTCGAPRPLVTLCPCLMPMQQTLQALGRSLGVKAFDSGSPDAHLLWFLLRVIESPLPQPFVWSLRHQGDADQPFLGFASPDGTFFSVDHPAMVEHQEIAQSLRGQIAAAGGAYTPAPLQAAFVSPEADSARDSPVSADSAPETARDGSDGTFQMPEGLTQQDFEEALAAAASHEAQRAGLGQTASGMPGVAHQGSLAESSISDVPLDAADVFRHCMSGSVDEVRRFLEQGGYADTVYKSAYGWDVGPDWLFTKPNDGTTVLNYVATWTDIIGEKAPELVALLLQHGADLQRDDGLDQWFTPLHNAVANGAHDVIEVILQHQVRAFASILCLRADPLEVVLPLDHCSHPCLFPSSTATDGQPPHRRWSHTAARAGFVRRSHRPHGFFESFASPQSQFGIRRAFRREHPAARNGEGGPFRGGRPSPRGGRACGYSQQRWPVTFARGSVRVAGPGTGGGPQHGDSPVQVIGDGERHGDCRARLLGLRCRRNEERERISLSALGVWAFVLGEKVRVASFPTESESYECSCTSYRVRALCVRESDSHGLWYEFYGRLLSDREQASVS